jgi:hypothetical protein
VYTPGAGHVPPVLAGRDSLVEAWVVMLAEVASEGRVRAVDTVLSGPRGVGKTVALAVLSAEAKERGFEVIDLQAVAGYSGLIDSLAQRAEERVTAQSGPWTRARQALERVGGVNVSLAGVGAGVSLEPDRPRPRVDAGVLAAALAAVALEARQDNPAGGLLITLDEMHVAAPPDLALLSAALHQLNTAHPTAPVVFAGTALPSIRPVLDRAGVTHADRLFRFEEIPLTLSPADARYAIVEPARRKGVLWKPAAVDLVIAATRGYPAHVQLFAHEVWRVAPGPAAVTRDDAAAGLDVARATVEKQTLEPRWRQRSGRQREFLAALAVLGGTAPIARVAQRLGKTVRELSAVRRRLIDDGEIYSPEWGQVTLAMPAFSDYILAHYEATRAWSSKDLLSLDDMSG